MFGLSFSATAQFSTIKNFNGGSDGGYPFGSLISDGTFLYGMTSADGANGDGVVFKIKPDGTSFTKLFDFSDATSGSIPMGSLYYDGTFLYGMTSEGGANTLGTIFKIKPDGTGYLKLLDFDGAAKGSYPQGDLISDGTYLYGLTRLGGTNDVGCIFKIKPDGTSFVKIFDFSLSTYGGNPWGSLYSDGTFLYGTTEYGGASSLGVVFKVSKDGSSYVKLVEFSGSSNGTTPRGSLISDGTFLYGLTTYGGINDEGVIFKVQPNGTGYSKLHDFSLSSTGKAPHGSLVLVGTTLYGMNIEGGANDGGVLFKIKTDGSGITKLIDFNTGSNGDQPFGSLLAIGSDLYGMCYDGGAFAAGNIFKYGGVPVAISELSENDQVTFYPNPNKGKLSINLSQAKFEDNETSIQFFNELGQCVFKTTTFNQQDLLLDLTDYNNGIYFMRVSNGTKLISKKIILQK